MKNCENYETLLSTGADGQLDGTDQVECLDQVGAGDAGDQAKVGTSERIEQGIGRDHGTFVAHAKTLARGRARAC